MPQAALSIHAAELVHVRSLHVRCAWRAGVGVKQCPRRDGLYMLRGCCCVHMCRTQILRGLHVCAAIAAEAGVRHPRQDPCDERC